MKGSEFVHEVRVAKVRCEGVIADAIRAFMHETGLEVTAVSLRIDYNFGPNKGIKHIAVGLSAELPDL